MKDSYVAALLEDMNGKFDLLMERFDFMRRDIDVIQRTLEEIKEDNRTHKMWLNDHEIRITDLEAAA